MPLPDGLLLGEPDPSELERLDALEREEREALSRRHSAALKVLRHLHTSEERMDLLRAVVWPSDDLVELVRAIDAGERETFDLSR